METNETLAANVKKYRQRCDLSQEEFANTIGLSPSHLREIEHARGNPTLDTLDRIAKGLEVTPEAQMCIRDRWGLAQRRQGRPGYRGAGCRPYALHRSTLPAGV